MDCPASHAGLNKNRGLIGQSKALINIEIYIYIYISKGYIITYGCGDQTILMVYENISMSQLTTARVCFFV